MFVINPEPSSISRPTSSAVLAFNKLRFALGLLFLSSCNFSLYSLYILSNEFILLSSSDNTLLFWTLFCPSTFIGILPKTTFLMSFNLSKYCFASLPNITSFSISFPVRKSLFPFSIVSLEALSIYSLTKSDNNLSLI